VSAYLVGAGWLLAGGIVFLVGGGLDLLDGGLARLTGKASPFGALLDSVFDRLSEAALFVGIAVYALRDDISEDRQIFFITVLLLALIFSQGVSYLRARGEGLGVFTKAGLMTRPERVVLLGVGLIIGQIEWMLLAIAVVSCFTLFQRMFTIRDMLDKTG
jgi:CDP-diacylglycerol--glycerol-3-phosphate 3-phosphatidyltransferase